MRKILIILSSTFIFLTAHTQGFFSGDLELRNDYYIKDTAIGAAGTNHFDDLKSSMDSWLSVNYQNSDLGFDAGIRLDLYMNSRLHNPNQDAYTAFGVGNWYVRKSFSKLTLTGGGFYDQFGSGLIFRSYEDRFLGIDNAMYGIHAKYDINEHFTVKAFAGVPKNRMEYFKTFTKGANVEAYYRLGSEEKTSIIPGIAAVNRTIDEESMSTIANIINAYPNIEDRFVPKYNTYLFSAYNTLNIGRVSWYIEGAFKTKEAIKVAEGANYNNKAGNAIFTSLSYSKKGFGISAQFKRIDNFQFRSSPEHTGTVINGALNFIAPVNRQNSLRLPARYSPATSEIEETSASLDFTYTPKKGHTLNFNFSEIHTNDLDFETYFENTLFREIYIDYNWKASKKIKTMYGVNFIQYNRDYYEGPSGYPTAVYAVSPFFELTHKIDRKKSLRYELQYQYAKKDFGHWVYGLVEFNVAPKISLSISDMWNVKTGPNKSSKTRAEKIGKNTKIKDTGIHYFSVFASYTEKQHRFYISYVRQVEGIVCTGGVCRLEPAFNGVRAGINTSF